MLSGRSQIKAHIFRMSRTGKSTETERRLAIARDWGRGHEERLLMGLQFVFGVIKIRLL